MPRTVFLRVVSWPTSCVRAASSARTARVSLLLDGHLFVPADTYDLRNAIGIVRVGLVDFEGQRRLGVSCRCTRPAARAPSFRGTAKWRADRTPSRRARPQV